MQLPKSGVFALLCLLNLMNHLDRGIISGAPDTFGAFIGKTLHVPVEGQSFYIGLLASAFVATYSILSTFFGYLARHYRPFRLIAFGMTIWVISVFISGLAYFVSSYYVLILGRLLSGVGEASFQCIAVPFLYAHADPKSKAAWMGVFLTFIGIGQAGGYIYGAAFANSPLTWAGAFFTEGILMCFLIIACLFLVPEKLDVIAITTKKQLSTYDSLVGQQSSYHYQKESDTKDDVDSSFVMEVLHIFTHPVFLLIVVGYSAFLFSLNGLNDFAPVIFLGLKLFKTETEVSLIFGLIVVLAATVGTLLGSFLVHKTTNDTRKTSVERCYQSVSIISLCMAIAIAFACLMMLFVSSKFVFFAFLSASLIFLMAISLPESIAIMECFSEKTRPLAISCKNLSTYVLGNVMSPMILGYLKDRWAPHCGSVEINGHAKINPLCSQDQIGLKNVLWFIILWLTWATVAWGVAQVVVRRKCKRRQFRSIMSASAQRS